MNSVNTLAARLLAAFPTAIFTRECDEHLFDAEVQPPQEGLGFALGYDLKLAMVPMSGKAAFDVYVCKPRPLAPKPSLFVMTPARKPLHTEETGFPIDLLELLDGVATQAEMLADMGTPGDWAALEPAMA